MNPVTAHPAKNHSTPLGGTITTPSLGGLLFQRAVGRSALRSDRRHGLDVCGPESGARAGNQSGTAHPTPRCRHWYQREIVQRCDFAGGVGALQVSV